VIPKMMNLLAKKGWHYKQVCAELNTIPEALILDELVIIQKIC
jgi:hypothetical protein